jgi:hypothetical protein
VTSPVATDDCHTYKNSKSIMLKRAHIVGCLLAVASFSCGAQTAYSEGNVGASGRILYKFSLTGKTAVAVGSGAGVYGGAPIEPVVGLAFGPDKKLYAIASTVSSPFLVTLSTLSGVATLVAPLSSNVSADEAAQASLAFDCNGALWMSSAQSNNLWKVDAVTGQAQLIGNLGAQITGIAARNGTLYGAGGAVDKVGPNPNFYSINTTTGQATLIGSYGVTGWVSTVSPAFDANGQLWGLIGSFPTQSGGLPTDWSSLAQIGDSGAMTVLGSITAPSAPILKNYTMSGLAIAPPVCTNGGGSTGGGSPVVNPTAPTLSVAAWLILILGIIALAAIGGAGVLRRQA